MATIKAKIEGKHAVEVITFTSEEVVEYHMPKSVYGWDHLCAQDQISFSENYALWIYARQFGNMEDLRVGIEIIDLRTDAELFSSGALPSLTSVSGTSMKANYEHSS